MALWAALAAPQSAPSHPRPAGKVIRIRAEDAPAIDGDLSDPVWSTVAPLPPPRQRLPLENAEPTERTEVRIAQDGKAIYIALFCYDSEPQAIRATQPRRDADLDPDDRVELVIDPLHDHRNAYFFQISPGGSIGDALISSNGARFNKAWDGIWDGRARITKEGWFAELRIPVRTMATLPEVTTWGFNYHRNIRRKLEAVHWASARFDTPLFRLSEAGDLEGLDGLEPGIGLDLVPYIRGSASRQRLPDDTDLLGTGGGELFYRLTPGITGALTANTDFAETEVDDRQVNLTRFPLFFPEKRKFFLEDAGVFAFETGGGTFGSSDLVPFFSRRVGLARNGSAIPILAGTKVSGYEGPWSIGALGVETDRDGDLDNQQLFATRVRRNLDSEHTVGTLFTSGDPSGREDNTVGGFDWRYVTRRLAGGKNLDVSAFFLKSFTPSREGNDRAMGLEVDYPNDLWRWRARAREIGDDFDPALGFVRRRGVRAYDGTFAYQPRPGGDVRQLFFGVTPQAFTDLSGDLLDTAGSFFVGALLESGDEARVRVVPSYEKVTAPFEIVPGLLVPAEEYSQTRVGVNLQSANRRDVVVEVDGETGRFDDGERHDLQISAALRPNGSLQTALETEQSWLHLPGGDAYVLVTRLRTELNLSPDLSIQTLAQFDNISESFGINNRLRWILEPGKDLFVVLNHNWQELPNRSIVPTDTDFVAKLVLTFRF